MSMVETLTEFDVDILVKAIREEAELVVHNDDVNTFDWVITSLMEICGHTENQAEQLSLIIHFKGKASVKKSTYDDLKPMKDALCDRGISAVIEKVTYEE